MPIQIEEIEYCKLKVNYLADIKSVIQIREEALNALRKEKIKVPGFRAGKATDQAIKSNCKKWIDDFVKKELLANAYDDLLYETKIKTIGYPQVLQSQLIDNTFTCDMLVLKKPEFKLGQYKDFKIPLPHENISVNDLAERMLQQLRATYGDVIPYGPNDLVHFGDQITLTYRCMIDNELFDEYSKEATMYKVGESPIPDFDKNIVGMIAGETKDFDIIFIENVKPELINKRAKFTVTVHMGTKHIPHSLDDELAKKVGLKDLLKLRAKIQGDASRQQQAIKTQLLAQQVVKRLLNNHDIKVPDWLLLVESQQLARSYNLDWSKISDDDKKILNDQSEKSVKLSLILDSVRDAEPESTLSDNEILSVIKERLKQQGQDPDEFLKQANNNGSLFGMVASLKDEGTLQWILSKCKIVN